jgi:hypothetical protein
VNGFPCTVEVKRAQNWSIEICACWFFTGFLRGAPTRCVLAGAGAGGPCIPGEPGREGYGDLPGEAGLLEGGSARLVMTAECIGCSPLLGRSPVRDRSTMG